jgi:hypothetical protein
MSRRKASQQSSDVGTRRVRSPNGRLTFTLTRAARGVYVERIEATSKAGQTTHAMLVRSAKELARCLETDETRYSEPALYQAVQRYVEEMLDAEP